MMIPVLATNSSTTDFGLEAYINHVCASCLVDTGAAVSLISEGPWERIKEAGEQLSQTEFGHKLVGVQGAPLQLCGSTRVRLEIDGLQKVYLVDVLVAKAIANDAILGLDFVQENQCQVRLDCKCSTPLHCRENCSEFGTQTKGKCHSFCGPICGVIR